MQLAFYGLCFETPKITLLLWSPWRATALEHKLFEAIRQLPRLDQEQAPDEIRIHISDAKTARSALQTVARVLMGWQDDADPASEKRSWRWLLEADTDTNGYDHTGEPVALWGFLRLSLERGGPGEPDKGEDIDLESFGLQIHASGAV